VIVELIDPRYTSQACSRCNCIGVKGKSNRITTKQYMCVNCGHTDHADSNAGFNIAMNQVQAWSAI
jgi:putative transposase